MALEAQEVAVRVRLLGGSAFQKEADGVERSIKKIGTAGRDVNAKNGLLGSLANAGVVLGRAGVKVQRFGQEVRNTGRTMSMLSLPLAYAGYQSIRAATNFQQAMTLLRSQANDSLKDVNFLTKGVMGMAVALGTTPTELAQGLYPIVSSSLHGKQALDALRAAAIGAKIGLDTLPNTANALMGVFNTHLKGAGNFKQIMATIDQLVGQAKMKLPDLMEALHSEIVPLAKDVGLRFQDVGTAIAAMTRMHIPAQRAANLMKLSLTKMFSPTGAGLKALQNIGLTQFQLADDLRKKDGLLTALSDLHNHLRFIGKDQQNSVLAAAFGQSRGIANIASLLNAIPTMRQIQRVADNATPATLNRHFAQTRATYAFKLAQLQAQLQKSLITLGYALLPTLLPLLKELTKVVQDVTRWFNQLSPGTRALILKIVALGIVLGPVLWVFGSLFTVIGGGMRLLGFFFGLFSEGSKLWGATAALISMFSGVETEAAALRLGFLSLIGPIGLVTAAFIALYPSIKRGIHNLVQNIKHPHRAVKQDLHGMVSGGGMGSGAGAYTPGMMGTGGGGGLDLPLIGHISLPFMATGGTIRRSGMAVVGEAGPELLTLPRGAQVDPLPHLTGMGLVPSMSDISGSMSGSWDVTVEVPLYLDGNMIAKGVNRVNREKANRR